MPLTEHVKPAEAFPVGEYLRDELEARGWTGAEFAAILGRPAQLVSEILNNRKEITPETATEIAAATGTEAQTRLRLQDSYRLWKLEREPRSTKLSAVQRRARLRALVPVAELVQRGAIPADDLGPQEAAICELLDIDSPDTTPRFAIAARRSDKGEALSPAQIAWLGCVRKSARQRKASRFDPVGLRDLAANLAQFLTQPTALGGLPDRLADVGVRLVHITAFRNSKSDGAAFLDEGAPVIGISGRIARFDSVIFTVLHEIAHIDLRHIDRGYAVDVDLGRDVVTGDERDADQRACEWTLPQTLSITPPISRRKVLAEAQRLGVHPALVVGRLHHREELPWSQLNALVPKVRQELETWDAGRRGLLS